MHNHNSTTHLGKLKVTIMPLGACYHSDVFQECVHVVGEMKVSEFQEFRSLLDENTHLMTPSRQALF